MKKDRKSKRQDSVSSSYAGRGDEPSDVDGALGEDEHAGETKHKGMSADDLKEGAEGKGGSGPEKEGPTLRKESKKQAKGMKNNEKVDYLEMIKSKNEALEMMRKRLEESEEVIKQKEDRLLRVIAEFENYKKRTFREQDLLKTRMYSDILGELLPVLDDFDRAFEMEPEGQDNFFDGIKLIHNRFRDTLSKMGLEEIEAEGEEFDPRYHEAMGEVESEDVEEGKIAYVVVKGYKLGDTVVRPSKVMLASRGQERG